MNTDPKTANGHEAGSATPAAKRPRRRTHVPVRFTVKEALAISEYANAMLEQHERLEFSDVNSSEFQAAARAIRKVGDALYPAPINTGTLPA